MEHKRKYYIKIMVNSLITIAAIVYWVRTEKIFNTTTNIDVLKIKEDHYAKILLIYMHAIGNNLFKTISTIEKLIINEDM